MIRINKNLSDVPASLNSSTTNKHRNEIIGNGVYNDKSDDRYKQKDITRKLGLIYHHKCAYCEKCVEDSFFHVEHYRPKSVYYWLAFSWDNLLLCCDKCNVYKSHNFEIENTVAARLEGDDLEQIHQLAAKYNSLEQPKLVHPELENDFEEKLVFDDKGKIYSQDSRCAYTISVCKIDRDSANDSRKKVFDSLRRKIESRFYEYKLGDKEALKEIKGLLRDFAEDAKDENNEYLAFRKYMVRTQKLFKNFSGS